MKNLLFSILIIGSAYGQCNESNWESYYPDMEGCDLSEANLSWANLYGAFLDGANVYGANLYDANLYEANLSWANLEMANLSGACLEGAIGFTQTNYYGTPILEGCAPNNFPVAQESTHTLDEDTVITLALEAYDEDGDVLSYTIVSTPTFGTATLSGNVATYIPNINFSGTDSFQFQVSDGQNYSNTAAVTLIINAINDAPYLYAIDNASIVEGETFSCSLQAEDADGDSLVYTVTISGGATATNIDGNILTITAQEPNVTLNIVVTVSDGNATHSIAFLLIVFQQQTACFDNNEDGWCDQFPTITLNGNSVLLFETEEGVEYTDLGAQCYDNEDGDISGVVEVGGQIVNISNPDVYEITYDCTDADENAAQTLMRTVVVVPAFISDENQDGFDDDAFMAGAQSGDANMDGILNVIDIVIFINTVLNGE